MRIINTDVSLCVESSTIVGPSRVGLFDRQELVKSGHIAYLHHRMIIEQITFASINKFLVVVSEPFRRN